MSDKLINLQNTPHLPGTHQLKVSFGSNGVLLKGILFTPSEGEGPWPGVIVTGAWTTVKEQMAGTYARELAARGYSALAFDFSGWGESGGEPRYVENPALKIIDIHAATDFMRSLYEVEAERIYGLGICASSGYMAEAVADNVNLQKVALIAPWLHDPQMAEEIYGGQDVTASLIAASEDENAENNVFLGASMTDDSSVMYQAPYYTEEDRGLIPAYDNKFSVLSWKPWLTYDAQASAERLSKPMLMIGSPSIALPVGASSYESRMFAPLEKIWLGDDVSQFDFYDRKDVVTDAADAVAKFLNH